MGATTFHTVSLGKTADEAFRQAVERARYDHGHSGYTGTIAEKDAFVLVQSTRTDLDTAIGVARVLIDDCDPRVNDKWGPAGCIELTVDSLRQRPAEGLRAFLFFGWASE